MRRRSDAWEESAGGGEEEEEEEEEEERDAFKTRTQTSESGWNYLKAPQQIRKNVPGNYPYSTNFWNSKRNPTNCQDVGAGTREDQDGGFNKTLGPKIPPDGSRWSFWGQFWPQTYQKGHQIAPRWDKLGQDGP